RGGRQREQREGEEEAGRRARGARGGSNTHGGTSEVRVEVGSLGTGDERRGRPWPTRAEERPRDRRGAERGAKPIAPDARAVTRRSGGRGHSQGSPGARSAARGSPLLTCHARLGACLPEHAPGRPLTAPAPAVGRR